MNSGSVVCGGFLPFRADPYLCPALLRRPLDHLEIHGGIEWFELVLEIAFMSTVQICVARTFATFKSDCLKD